MGEARQRRMAALANGATAALAAAGAARAVSLFVLILRRPDGVAEGPPFLVQAYTLRGPRGPADDQPCVCPCGSLEEARAGPLAMRGQMQPRPPGLPPHVVEQWKCETFRWAAPTRERAELAVRELRPILPTIARALAEGALP